METTAQRMGQKAAFAVLGQVPNTRRVRLVAEGGDQPGLYRIEFSGGITGSEETDPGDEQVSSTAAEGQVDPRLTGDVWIGVGDITVSHIGGPEFGPQPASITIFVNGTEEATLDPGQETTFPAPEPEPEPEPEPSPEANISIVDVSFVQSPPFETGSRVAVDVQVRNEGEASGSRQFSVTVNDEIVDFIATGTVAAGDRDTVTTEISTPDEPGTMEVQVGGTEITAEVVEPGDGDVPTGDRSTRIILAGAGAFAFLLLLLVAFA